MNACMNACMHESMNERPRVRAAFAFARLSVTEFREVVVVVLFSVVMLARALARTVATSKTTTLAGRALGETAAARPRGRGRRATVVRARSTVMPTWTTTMATTTRIHDSRRASTSTSTSVTSASTRTRTRARRPNGGDGRRGWSGGRRVREDEDFDSEEYFAGFLPDSKSTPLVPEDARGGRAKKGKASPRFNGEAYKTPAERRRARDEGERLNKALASLGVASRRGADDLIFGGRVKVNGVTVTAPATKVNVNADVVMVDGRVIEGGVSFVKEHTYFMLNKPKGFVCSAKPNSSGGKTVLDLFEQWREEFTSQFPGKLPPRLFTVGRLDVATTGLLLVTTDGDWCQRVAHPSSEVVKQYIVTANNKPTRAQISEMAKGTDVDGAHVVPVRVETMGGDGGPKNRILVEVVDGRNREVRVLCSNAGVDVKNLKRTRIGGLRMPKELPLGKYVRLQPHQVAHVLDKGLARNGGTF